MAGHRPTRRWFTRGPSMQTPEVPVPDSAHVCALHGEPVAAAIAPCGHHVAIASASRWAVFRSASVHAALRVPTALALVHTGDLTVPPPHPPGPLLPSPLAGAAFPPASRSAGAAAGERSLVASAAPPPARTAGVRADGSYAVAHGDVAAGGTSLVLWGEDGTAAVLHVQELVGARGEDGTHVGLEQAPRPRGSGAAAEVLLGVLPASGGPGLSAARDSIADGSAMCAGVGFTAGGKLVRMAALPRAVPQTHVASGRAASAESRACGDITNVVCGAASEHEGNREKACAGVSEVHAWDTCMSVADMPLLHDAVRGGADAAGAVEDRAVLQLAASSSCIADVFGKGSGGGRGMEGGERDTSATAGSAAGHATPGHRRAGMDGEPGHQEGVAGRTQHAGCGGAAAVCAWPRTTARTLLSTSVGMPPCVAQGRSDGSILLQPLMFAAVQTAAQEDMQRVCTHAPGVAAAAPPHLGDDRPTMHCSGLGWHPTGALTWGDGYAACIRVLHGHRRPITCMAEADLQRSIISVGILQMEEAGGDSPKGPQSPTHNLDSFPEEGGEPVATAADVPPSAALLNVHRSLRSLQSAKPRTHAPGPDMAPTIPELRRSLSGGSQATPRGLAALRSIFTGSTLRKARSVRSAHPAPPSTERSGSFEQARPAEEDAAGHGAHPGEPQPATAPGDSGSLPPTSASPEVAPPVDISESGGPCHRVLFSGCEQGRVCVWGVSAWAADNCAPVAAAAAAGEPQFAAGAADSPSRMGADAKLRSDGVVGGGLSPVLDPWTAFGEPLFTVHALTEPVWQIVLPPQNAPPPWHQCGPLPFALRSSMS